MTATSEQQRVLQTASERFGTPTYVYFEDVLRERARLITRAFADTFEISYAAKANPNRALLASIHPLVATLDVSSGTELEMGIEAGFAPEAITFSGPGKTRAELEAIARYRGVCSIVESLEEAAELEAIGAAHDTTIPILPRINPTHLPKGFGVGMAGRPSQFGIDEEEIDQALAAILRMPHLRVVGFHVYAGTQCLNAGAIAQNLISTAQLFLRLIRSFDLTPEHLVFGSGFGIPYTANDTPVDLDVVAEQCRGALEELTSDPRCEDARLFLELGRFLVGPAGYFVTQVRRIKETRGRRIAICDGGMNNHLAACGHMGSVVHRNYPMLRLGADHGPAQPYDLFGPLCTTIDHLALAQAFAGLAAGDLVCVGSSGAYGLTASPLYFISHPHPHEVLVRAGSSELIDITDSGAVAHHAARAR